MSHLAIKQDAVSDYDRVGFAVSTVQHCIRALETSLRNTPDEPQIGVVLATLDSICLAPYNDSEQRELIERLAETGDLARLRELLYDAECVSERYHTGLILSAPDGMTDLGKRVRTPYARMVKSELEMVDTYSPLPRSGGKCVFAGCGAMPLTSIYINHFSGMSVVALDNHQDCVDAGASLIKHMGRENDIGFACVAGEDYDYQGASLVYVACMVPNKLQVFNRIAATNPYALVITRGVTGAREMFYEPANIVELESAGWECLVVSPPPEGVRNTSYLLKYAA